MENVKITWNGDKEFTVDVTGFPEHTYAVIKKIPIGYFVWNINAEHMPKDYLPLCRYANQIDWMWAGENKVDVDGLCVIKTKHAALILDAASYGATTPDKAREFLERNANVKRGTPRYEAVRLVRKALPYLTAIWKY